MLGDEELKEIKPQKRHTLLCEMTIESIGKSFVTFFQRNHALVSKAKLLL